MPIVTAYPETAADLAAQIREAALDHEALSQPLRACVLSECRATCCHDGASLAEEEAFRLNALTLEYSERFAGYGLTLPEEPIVPRLQGRGWKTAVRVAEEQEPAADFPAHFPRTRCVFLDAAHRCAWQRLAMQDGLHPWHWKPLTCWMHPLNLRPPAHYGERPVLTLAVPGNDPQMAPGYPGFASCTHCGRPETGGAPAYTVLRDELEALGHLSGRDIYSELTAPPSR